MMDPFGQSTRKELLMRGIAMAFFLILGLPLAAHAQGTPRPLFNTQSGWAVASNTVFGSNGLPMAYDAAFDSATSSAANYVVTEEGSSNTFGSMAYTAGYPETWIEATTPINWATATISFSSGIYSESVLENSSALACVRNGVAAEYDMFLGPNSYDQGINVTSAINSAYRLNPALVPSIHQFASLAITGRMTINQVSQPSTPANCTVNHASVGFTFSFVDRVKNQNFSYTLHLASLCLPGPDYISCTHQPQNTPYWYKAGIVTAVNDTLVGLNSGLLILPNGQAPTNLPLSGAGTITFTALNLLPRIETLLENNPENLDTNIANWQISGLSYGTNIWGDSSLTTSWQGFSAAAMCNNADCS